MLIKKIKKSFTLIELIIVIIIIGILAAVAIPKLFATRDDAQITKIRTDVSTIRSAIANLYSKNIMKGINSYPEALDDAATNTENEELFDGNSSIGYLLDYAIYAKDDNGHWMKVGDTNYTVKIMNETIKFNYDPNDRGRFDCKDLNDTQKEGEICSQLTH